MTIDYKSQKLAVTPEMVKAAMPWLLNLHRMRKADKESNVEEAIRAALAVAHNGNGEQMGMAGDPVGFVDPALLAGLHKVGAEGGYINFNDLHPTAVQDQLPEHVGTAFETYEFSDGFARIMTRQEFDRDYGQALRIQLERTRDNRHLNSTGCRSDSAASKDKDGA